MKKDTLPEMMGRAFLNIKNHSPLSSNYKFIESVVMHEFLTRAKDGIVEISQPRLRELVNVSSVTANVFNKAMIESGRWEIVAGVGHSSTTYKPLFLGDIEPAAKKGSAN